MRPTRSQTESATGRRGVRRLTAAIAILAVVAAVPAAGIAAADAGPAAQSASDGAAHAQAADGQQAANATNGSDQFDMDATVVGRCGVGCRSVSANLTNVGNDTARNVTADIRITAGERLVWNRTYQLGTLAPNESVERIANLSVGARDAIAVQRNGGFVTVETTVESEENRTVFTRRRKVV